MADSEKIVIAFDDVTLTPKEIEVYNDLRKRLAEAPEMISISVVMLFLVQKEIVMHLDVQSTFNSAKKVIMKDLINDLIKNKMEGLKDGEKEN